MQIRPDAAELLDAVAAYLFGEVRPVLPREERFRVLVAANVCAVVGRELRAGGDPDRADATLFAELLGERASAAAEEDPRDLASRLAAEIRSGELDERLGEVAGRLREHVARKLEVARPGYTGE